MRREYCWWLIFTTPAGIAVSQSVVRGGRWRQISHFSSSFSFPILFNLEWQIRESPRTQPVVGEQIRWVGRLLDTPRAGRPILVEELKVDWLSAGACTINSSLPKSHCRTPRPRHVYASILPDTLHICNMFNNMFVHNNRRVTDIRVYVSTTTHSLVTDVLFQIIQMGKLSTVTRIHPVIFNFPWK